MLDAQKTRPRIGSHVIWVVVISWLGFAVRILQLGGPSLWYDEAYTWLMSAATGFWTGLEIALADFVHPPLYYLASRLFTLAGESEWVLRLPAVLAGTLSVPAIYLLGRRVGGRPVGLLSALLLALNPFHVWLSRDARSYSLAAFFSILIAYFFLRLLRGERMWVWFTLASALGFATHYFCLLLPLTQFAYFLLNFRRRYRVFRRWALSMAIASVPLLIWLIALYTQEEQMIGIAWIPTPKLWTPLLTLLNFGMPLTGDWTLWLYAALPLLAAALILGLSRRSPYRQWLVLWLFLPLVSVLVVSWGTGRNLYADRYFVICLPAYLLLVALGALRPRKRALQTLLTLALVILSAIGTMRLFVDPHFAKEDWRSAAQIVRENRQPGDLVVLRQAEDVVPLRYYTPHELDPWTFLSPRVDPDPWAAILDEYSPQRVWLMSINPIGSNHLLTNGLPFNLVEDGDETIRAWLAEHRQEIVLSSNLPGVGLVLVDLNQ